MRKNVNFIAAKNFKIIRKSLGAKQLDFKCPGIIQNISELETGAKRITEEVADFLVVRTKELEKKYGISLKYDINRKVFTGEINIITDDLLKKLDSETKISKEMISDIDNNIKSLENDKAIDFIDEVIQILYKDHYENAALIRKYALKLLNYKINSNTKLKANRYLITAYCALKKYEDAVYIAESIKEELSVCKDKSIKTPCYGNIASAYYELGLYEESLEYFKKSKQLGKANELFNLTLESDIAVMKLDYKKAEKGYLNVLAKAQSDLNNDYIVNSYSNLADTYRKMELKDKAIEYITKAIEAINCGTSRLFKLNAYFNEFLIYKESSEKIEEVFNRAFPLAIELNNLDKANRLLNRFVDYCIEIKAYSKIYNSLEYINDEDISSKTLLKIIRNTSR